MGDVVTSSALFEIFFSGVGQIESVIKFFACQESRVGGDGGTPKLQAYFGIEVELERVFSLSPIRCLRNDYAIRSRYLSSWRIWEIRVKPCPVGCQ